MDNISCYKNRELSWLKFNERVLEEAEDENNPLCERLNFLSIFQSNLDEFFMVRIGSLYDMMLLNKDERENKTNMTAEEQIDALFKNIRTLYKRKDKEYAGLISGLSKYNINIINFSLLKDNEAQYLENYFESEIRPLLSPFVVGKKQPFPFLKNKNIYAVVSLETKNEKEKLAIIPCTNGVFERLIALPMRPGYYMLCEELILHCVPKIFNKYKIVSKSLIRVTRNADIDADNVYDEDLNYRDHMIEVIKQRKKLCPIRLEMTRDLEGNIINNICDILSMEKKQVFKTSSPMDLSFLFKIQDLLRKKTNLFYPRRVPQNSSEIEKNIPVIEQIKKKDVLLSYPFESINPFLRMLHEAAVNPDVVSIKMTLYRLAKHSKVVEALAEAAENGKEVVVLVELKARFDEENNIEWSRLLEEAGCHVIYGIDGLKVHSKLCLITIKNDDCIEYITQIGTGNYNEKTSCIYTDLSLMTANPEMGKEALNIFNSLIMGETVDNTQHLLAAPNCMQNKIIDMIDEEIAAKKMGKDAYIGIKVNSLTDKKLIDKLIEASEAGIKVDMIIRGINCLQSGIKGKTDNIHIISIVGRFLEHSRIYIFGTGEREKIYISSADFMTRNMERRVEIAAPIYDKSIKERIRYIFNIMLKDNVKARVQMPDGSYVRKEIKEGEDRINSQEYFYETAYRNARKNHTLMSAAAEPFE